MAVNFTDLHTESGIKSLNEYLAGKSYITGENLTDDDVKVYDALVEKPNGDVFPNVSQWYDRVESHLSASYPGKEAAAAAAVVSAGSQVLVGEASSVKEAQKLMSMVTIMCRDVNSFLNAMFDLDWVSVLAKRKKEESFKLLAECLRNMPK